MEIYNTYMLGAGKLVDCEFVLVYSTDSFKKRADDLYLGESSISKSDLLPLLSKMPDKRTVNEVVKKLLLVKDRSGEQVYNVAEVHRSNSESKYYSDFVVRNRKDSVVGLDGFNVIVYLCSNGGVGYVPIGYSTFLESQGSSVYTESGKYMIRKNYYVRNLHIYIGFDNQLLFDTDRLDLLDNLYETANPDKNSIIGKGKHKYATLGSIDKITTNVERPLYSPRIYPSGNRNNLRQYIFSDSSSFVLGKGGDIVEKSKLCINKDLYVDRYNNAFGNYQVGFYKGDPALFVWNISNDYSIYSLSRKNRVGNVVMYTNPVNSENMIFNSSVHRLPGYGDGYSSKIEFFSGSLIQTSHTNLETGDVVRSIFDIDLQNTVDSKDNTGWLDFGDNTALLDPLDIKNNIIITKKLEFPNKRDAERAIPSISDIYFDLGKYSSENSINIEGKRGEWFIIGHPTIDIKIITNMTKAVIVTSSELSDVIFVNNQVLIVKSRDSNRPSEITYTLFDDDGNFITSEAKNYLSTYYSNLSLAEGYKVPDTTKSLFIDNSVSSTNSILDIQRSFLSYFRRNILPYSLTDFEIIGGLWGLIFYRLGSNINYL